MSSDTPFDHLEQCWRVDVYLVDVAPPRLLDLEQLLMDEPILLLLLVGLREMILKLLPLNEHKGVQLQDCSRSTWWT